MTLRPTQATTYSQVLRGIRDNTQRLIRAQEQTATGKRILRPSDDPVGSATSISLRRQLSSLSSYQSSVDEARPVVETAASEIEQASGLMTEARTLLLQGLNGALSQEDRNSVADQIEEVAAALQGVANARFGDRYLFAGTEMDREPFVTDGTGPDRFVSYSGNGDEQSVRIGRNVGVETNLPGNELFSGAGYTGTAYAGLTGLTGGVTVDQGTGFTRLHLRTDTVGGFAAGVTQAAGSSATILGEHELVFDADAGTVRLGDGSPVSIPTPLPTSLSVQNKEGGQLSLDLSAWDGTSGSMTLVGDGSISTDGVDWRVIDRTETDLELVFEDVGVIHVNTTGLRRSGEELITFRGDTNVFDALRGAAGDLRSAEEGTLDAMRGRLELRYDELVDHQNQTLVGLGRLGARARRLNDTENRLDEYSIQIQDRLSINEDADLTEVALDLSRTEQTLQVAMASGARLLQQSLLNFI